MYETKMVKVYLPSLQLCTFSLLANLLFLGINPLGAMAQDSPVEAPEQRQAANTTNNISQDLAPEILAEINRVRTNPQGYADWLEAQRQYYDGSWIRLPGEKPIRTTSRGIKALNEAIALLKELQPLPPLEVSPEITNLATQKLDNFATANNIQFISYGRTTPKGIVMSLVIDELFPDRRRRDSLLSEEASNTGVVCKPDPRYAKVCAIAYSNSPRDSTAPPATSSPNTPSQDSTIATAPEAETATLPEPPPPEDTVSTPETASEPQPTQPPQPPTPTPEIADSEPEPAELPKPPTPEPPTPEPPAAEDTEESESVELPEPPTPEPPAAEDTEESESVELPEPSTPEPPTTEDTEESESVELPEPSTPEPPTTEDTEEVAVNSSPPASEDSRILENVERGILEDGDPVIAEDGSFYDSYPLEAKAGDSFIISLESDEFDAFVALIDAKGNIIDQNDDIDRENSNSRIRVTIPEDGTYNIIVNAYDEQGRGNYILTVRR